MKTLEEIKPLICGLYKTILCENPDELNFKITHAEQSYIIGRSDIAITIPRKHIDVLIDRMSYPGSREEEIEANQFILQALMCLKLDNKEGSQI
jgi:hypothetical protein